ncbi:MAG: alanine dehydrogenase [Bacteroidales bacterium]|nr:alanine dehydrogenase [Bacteroidales bacterium]MDZ4203282.1 alanine dehydrogenase [Bacteroidales bacterium]
MLILNQEEVKQIIPLSQIDKVVKCVESAFLKHGKGEVDMPPKTYLFFKKDKGDLRIMPSFSEELGMAGTKIVNVHPDNPKNNLPTVGAVIVLNDAKTGIPIAFMDGTYITGVRTGAAGAVASKYLAKKDAKTLGVIGAGQQAIFQIAATACTIKLQDILVYDVNEKSIELLSVELEKIGIKIRKAGLEEVSKQDILTTTTPSRDPIVKNEWVMPGMHINAVGADAEGKEELDPTIYKRAKIVVDDWIQASHSGEINVPVAKGMITKSDIYGSLGEIVAGIKIGRENNEEITVFDSTGLGIQDLFTAVMVYEEALKRGAGKNIEIF